LGFLFYLFIIYFFVLLCEIKFKTFQETQRKYSDYRELSSSLHVWIRESTLLMQDRNFPNTLIEVKKLALESNRFRTDEVPPRLREKQHITRLYKDIEVINRRC
jgi:hypothetical protein